MVLFVLRKNASMTGTYTILIECTKTITIKFGKRGYSTVAKGYYLYTGSALGKGTVSLEGRVRRHLRSRKKPKWHVDYLTSKAGCKVKAAICLISTRRLECLVNRVIAEQLNTRAILPRLGATDCKCEAHLVKVRPTLRVRGIIDRLRRSYSRFGDRIVVMKF